MKNACQRVPVATGVPVAIALADSKMYVNGMISVIHLIASGNSSLLKNGADRKMNSCSRLQLRNPYSLPTESIIPVIITARASEPSSAMPARVTTTFMLANNGAPNALATKSKSVPMVMAIVVLVASFASR